MPAHPGSRHHKWKGKRAGYRAIHYYVRRRFPFTGRCVVYGQEGKTTIACALHRHGDGAPIYTRDPRDYLETCIGDNVRLDRRRRREAIA